MNNFGSYKNCYEVVKKLTEENKPFPDGFIASILSQEIGKSLGAARGVILDGFPRRIKEAEELVEIIRFHDLSLAAAIKFNVDYDTVKRRVQERQYCPSCGKFYNQIIKPKIVDLCDDDGAKLIKRPDDYLEILEERFNAYMEESIDAFNFLIPYAKASFDVNANQDEISLFAEIITKLNSQSKTSHHIYCKTGQTKLQTEFGEFDLMGYQNVISYDYHLVLARGDLGGNRKVPLRVHSSCITGDIFHSQKCDCGEQLHKALDYIDQQGTGLVIYLLQEGRGINIINKIKAYELQSEGLDTIDANEYLGLPPDLREYDAVKDILSDLQIKSIVLLTNSPEKMNKLQDLGVIIEGRVPIEAEPTVHNTRYLKTKKDKMGHRLSSANHKEMGLTSNLELEIKFLLTTNEAAAQRETILKLPDVFFEGRAYEKTTMLDNSFGQMQREDARLRVREIRKKKDDTISKIEFSYKKRLRADGGIKQEEEIETAFATDVGSFLGILNKMGYVITTSYERYRETYRTLDAKITLDEFPFGYVLEIEGGERSIEGICKELGLAPSKSYPLSCDDAYVELCEKKGTKPKDHILFDDPEMPHLG